jgi:transposase
MAYAVAMETLAALPSDIWDWTPPEAQAYIRALEARLSALSMVQALQEQNRALQEQLNQTSRNTSRPPSSDPSSSPRPKRPRSQRRRGGQAGHRGQTRTLIPVEDVDEVVPTLPTELLNNCR